VLFGRGSCAAIGTGQCGRTSQRLDERVFVNRIDQHAGLRRDEFRRPADPRRDDRSPAGHRLEHGLSEGLDQARLADDVCCRDLRRDAVVWKRTREFDPRPALELSAQRPVADERQRPFTESLKSARETEHVLSLDE
jgi:hypothetical protein